MHQLDFAIVAVVALGAIYGLSRGVLRTATSIVALAAGVYLASIYYPLVAEFVHQQFALGATAAAAVGYVVVFAAVFAAIAVAGEVFTRVLHIVRLGWIDRLCGAAAGVAVSSAMVGLSLMILTAILPVNAAILRQSELTPIMLRYAETLIAYVPDEVKDAYRAKRDELWRLWLERAPSASPSPSPSPGKR